MTEQNTAWCKIQPLRLANAVKRAKKAASAAYPCVELRSGRNSVIVRAASTLFGIEIDIPAEIFRPFEGNVSPDLLLTALKTIAEDRVEICVHEEHSTTFLRLEEEGSLTAFVPLDLHVNKCPWVTDGVANHETVGTTWIDALRTIRAHVTDDDRRFNLHGIYFEHDGAKGTFVGTDGRRMAVLSEIYDFPTTKGIVLRPELPELLTPDAPVSLGIGREYVHLEQDDVEIWAQTIKTTFPPFANVVPKSIYETHAPQISIDRATFEGICWSLHDLDVPPFLLKIEDGRLWLRSPMRSIDRLSAESSLPYEGIPWHDQAVGINPDFLCDALTLLHEAERIVVFSEGPFDPVVLTNEDRSRIAVIMPMRF